MGRLGNPLDRDRVGGEPRRYPIGTRALPDRIGGPDDLAPQPLVYLIEPPSERRPVLCPLEVAHDHAARIAQGVGNRAGR